MVRNAIYPAPFCELRKVFKAVSLLFTLLGCMVVCALSEKAESIIRHLSPLAQIQTKLYSLLPKAQTCAMSSSHQSSRLLKEFFSSQRHCDHGMSNDWWWLDWKTDITTQKHARLSHASGCRTTQPTWNYLKKSSSSSSPNSETISHMLDHERDPQNPALVSSTASSTEV